MKVHDLIYGRSNKDRGRSKGGSHQDTDSLLSPGGPQALISDKLGSVICERLASGVRNYKVKT